MILRLILISCNLGDLIGYNRNWNSIDTHFSRRLFTTRPKDDFSALEQISNHFALNEKYEKLQLQLKLFEKVRRETGKNSNLARKKFTSEKRNLRIRNYIRKMRASRI